ncbi:hypothetical protein T07_6606, partial [Trichinella nelsoni]
LQRSLLRWSVVSNTSPGLPWQAHLDLRIGGRVR